MIKSIPLNKLVASPRNVRRAGNPQADLELKADIEARGLLQNLVVSSTSKPRGCFAVEGGERRRRALQALADDGKLAADHEVSCLVIDRDLAAEASLAENVQRLAMNPADECLAFSTLIEQGSDVESIARRFGLTIRFVEGRLRLAGLAPEIFEALGAGEISLDVAKAYAASPDRERQSFVFEQVGRSYGAGHPDSIRRMMTQATIGAGDRRARFIGEDAYVAAGGRIEQDLFSDADGARWLDVELVERLASEKLEALAAVLAAEHGFAFVRPTLDSWVGYPATDGLRRIVPERAPLSSEEAARASELEAEIEDLAAELEDFEYDDAAREPMEVRLQELGAALDAILDRPPLIDEALKAKVGVFLLIDEQGQPKLDGVFYAPIPDEPPIDPSECKDETGKQPEPSGKPKLSRRLVDELAMQRRDILAVHVAANAAFAGDLATFLMVDREIQGRGSRGSSLSAPRASDPVIGFRTPDARASVAAAQANDALDRSWTEHATPADRFDAFRAMPAETRAAWLGHAVARTLEASANLHGDRACAFHDHLGDLLGLDVAQWWRPTGVNFFDRVPKSVALAALTEVGGPALAGSYANVKKAELAASCERIFAGDFIAEPEVKAAAIAWVPEALRFAKPVDDPNVTQDEAEAGEPPNKGLEEAEVIGEAA